MSCVKKGEGGREAAAACWWLFSGIFVNIINEIAGVISVETLHDRRRRS
ncbi:MAG: hypothetical protein ACKESB_03240 [Candidatus Hodgkinia cicadicola]